VRSRSHALSECVELHFVLVLAGIKQADHMVHVHHVINAGVSLKAPLMRMDRKT